MSTFKIGDLVRVVNNESGRADYTGKVGTVTSLEPSSLGGEIFVTWDPESGARCFMPSELVKTDEG